MIWNTIAKIVSWEPITKLLIWYSKREPYLNLDGYMNRNWVFNPYDPVTRKTRYPIPFSARVHHILRKDLGRHPHDHPWNARTIILRGWYREVRDGKVFLRKKGDTATLDANTYHHVEEVSEGGVFTLFMTGGYQHQWGFLVDGTKVPHNEYKDA